MSLYSAPILDKKSAEKKKYPPVDYSSVDVYSMVEQYTSVRLGKGTKSKNGICPYPGCSSTHDSFVVYADIEQTKKHIHYWCRKCDRSGDLIQLLRDINNWTFKEAKERIGLLSDEDKARPRYSRMSEAARQREEERKLQVRKSREEIEMLRHLYPHMQAALAKYPRPQAYLAERGITLEQALEHGLGYIPFESETGRRDTDPELRKWTGRIIFPLTGKGDGMTFAGRTLNLWKRGMSPEEHKKLLDEYNKQAAAQKKSPIIRVLKTSPCGFYGYADAVADDSEHIVACEGEFDGLSLKVAGVDRVVATGQYPHAKDFPLSLMRVTIALDSDTSGKKAMHKLSIEFEAAGINVKSVFPQGGKDWNDMLIAGKSEDIKALFYEERQAPNAPEPEPEPEVIVEYDLCGPCLDNGVETPATHYYEAIGHCETHYRALGLPLERMSRDKVRDTAILIASEWPGGCEVHEDPPDFTIEDSARVTSGQLRMCERAGEKQCMFMTVVETRDNNAWLRKGKRCTQSATHNGWCEEHKLSDEFLQLGMRLYYREVRLHECRSVAPGVRNWEAYAKLVSKERLQGDIALLKAMIA